MRLHAIIEYANIAYLCAEPLLKIGGKSIYPMFQVEQRFEQQMINFGEEDRPIRHYPIAEVVAGHLVLHIIGTQPIQEPGGHAYKRHTHLVVTKVGIAAEILNQNEFEEVAVFVAIPPLSPSSPAPAVKRCTAIFECRDKNYPDTKAWGCEFEAELFIDPTDDVELQNTASKIMLWVSK